MQVLLHFSIIHSVGVYPPSQAGDDEHYNPTYLEGIWTENATWMGSETLPPNKKRSPVAVSQLPDMPSQRISSSRENTINFCPSKRFEVLMGSETWMVLMHQ